jgi:hypothetical protein
VTSSTSSSSACAFPPSRPRCASSQSVWDPEEEYWGWIDNRPFLRCLHGYGLCLWRLDRVEEAARVFGRMLWLNPSDNQGVRFLIDDIATGRPWRPDPAR